MRATADEHADLFWALRGGGGNFGVVTAMEFRLFPYGEVYAGMMLWPYERADEVLRAWRDWTRTAPEDVTTSMRIMHFPPLPELPDFLRGRSVVVIDGAFAGERGRRRRGDRGAARARARARHLGDGPGGRAQPHPHGPRGADAVPQRLDACSARSTTRRSTRSRRTSSPARRCMFAELRHLGGALGARAEGAGAVGSFDGRVPLLRRRRRAWGRRWRRRSTRRARARARRSRRTRRASAYLNFVEQPTDPATFYTEDAYARLRAVRAAVDPDGVMVGNHPIPASG